MPAGRPSLYKKAFCQLALEMGAEGKSKAQIAAAIGVARFTVDEWCKVHQEFADSIAHARDLALAWWEDTGQTGMWQSPEGVKLNPQLWSRSMAARFPDDYRENSKVEIAGKLDINKLSDAELDEALAAELARSTAASAPHDEIAPQGEDVDDML